MKAFLRTIFIALLFTIPGLSQGASSGMKPIPSWASAAQRQKFKLRASELKAQSQGLDAEILRFNEKCESVDEKSPLIGECERDQAVLEEEKARYLEKIKEYNQDLKTEIPKPKPKSVPVKGPEIAMNDPWGIKGEDLRDAVASAPATPALKQAEEALANGDAFDGKNIKPHAPITGKVGDDYFGNKSTTTVISYQSPAAVRLGIQPAPAIDPKATAAEKKVYEKLSSAKAAADQELLEADKRMEAAKADAAKGKLDPDPKVQAASANKLEAERLVFKQAINKAKEADQALRHFHMDGLDKNPAAKGPKEPPSPGK